MNVIDRDEVLREIKHYFDIEELVCNHVLERWGEDAWQFLDTIFLTNLLILRRDVIQKPMYCNNHKRKVYQRGLRCNLCEMVKEKDRPYLSAHVLGKGADFSIEDIGGVAMMERMRQRVRALSSVFVGPIRMEKDVSWLHFDCLPNPYGLKLYEFNG
jgi:hypothetical protein